MFSSLLRKEGVQTLMFHLDITFSSPCVQISHKGSNSRQPCIPIHNISTMPSSYSKHFLHLFPPSFPVPTLTATILEIETCFLWKVPRIDAKFNSKTWNLQLMWLTKAMMRDAQMLNFCKIQIVKGGDNSSAVAIFFMRSHL